MFLQFKFVTVTDYIALSYRTTIFYLFIFQLYMSLHSKPLTQSTHLSLLRTLSAVFVVNLSPITWNRPEEMTIEDLQSQLSRGSIKTLYDSQKQNLQCFSTDNFFYLSKRISKHNKIPSWNCEFTSIHGLFMSCLAYFSFLVSFTMLYAQATDL